MVFEKLSWRKQKSQILPLAASLCIDRYDLTLYSIHRGSGLDYNFTFQVEAREGKYLIRVYSPSYDYDRIRSTLWWQSQINLKENLVVPVAVPGVDGEVIQRTSPQNTTGNYHYCVLFEWIEAPLLSSLREDSRFNSMMQNFGIRLAQMHSLYQNANFPEWFTLPERGSNALGHWITRLKSEPPQDLHPDFDAYENHPIEDLIDRAQELQNWMDKRSESPQHFGIIHGDLNCDNLLFQGTEPCFIDFAPLCRGHFIMDLVKALDFAVPDHNHDDFLSGYSSVRTLPNDFDKGLKVLKNTRMSVQNWF